MADPSGASMVPRWAIPLLCVLLGGIGGVAYTLLTKPTYTASSTVVVTATPSTGDRRDVSLAQALGRLANQPEIATAAAATVGLTADQVARSVRGRTSPDAPIIEITGDAPTAAKAAEVVNAVATGLVTFGTKNMAATGVTLSVLSAATPPLTAGSPSLTLDLAVGVGAGILLGALYLLATGGRKRSAAPPGAAVPLPGALPSSAPRPGPPAQAFPPPPGSGPRPPAGGPPRRPPPPAGSPNNRPGPPPGPPRAPVPPTRQGGRPS